MARKKAEPKVEPEESPKESSEEEITAELQRRVAAEKAAAPQADPRKAEICSICGVSAEDMEIHNAWHQSQQVKYTELAGFHEGPGPTLAETALFAPSVEVPEAAPQAVVWTAADPDATPNDGLTIIHTP